VSDATEQISLGAGSGEGDAHTRGGLGDAGSDLEQPHTQRSELRQGRIGRPLPASDMKKTAPFSADKSRGETSKKAIETAVPQPATKLVASRASYFTDGHGFAERSLDTKADHR
jgi:hypothetical protein